MNDSSNELSTLGGLGKWSGGQTPLKSHLAYWDNGNVLWISPKDVRGSEISDSGDKITEVGLRGTRLRLYPNDSIFVVVRSGILRHYFPVCRCTKPFTVNQDLKVLETNDDVDSTFAFFLLTHLSPIVLRRAVKAGTTVESVDMTSLLKLEARLPPPTVQRKIARILTTLDNLIKKTEALIAKYQTIKQGMMHDLFTRGVDSSGQLRPTQEQAPELYKQSELGWIPTEWDEVTLGDELKRIEQGWSPDCDSIPAKAGQWGVLKTTAVVWEGYADHENKVLPPTLEPRTEFEVRKGDILMTRGGPNSRVGVVVYVYDTQPKLMMSDKLYRIVPNATFDPEYLVLALSSANTQMHLSRLKTGLAESQTNISQAIVRRLRVARPKPGEQKEIAKRIRSISKLITCEGNTLAKRKEHKSGLMQDLLTGKVRVKVDEAEEVAAHA